MKQKLFLTSCIAMGFVAPAFAEPSYTDTFPDDGYMQEDYTYTNAATADNMDSVYEGSVNAVAEYDIVDYILSAGQYLPADSDVKTTCPAGSFCAGGTFQYDEDSDQGLTSCPIIDTAQFTSDAGSSAVTACYQDSTKSSAELNPFTTAHLNTSKNTDGYINGVKYKSATTTARRYATSATTAGEWAALDESDLAITDLACANGYHYKAGLNVEDTIGNESGSDDYAHIDNSGAFRYNGMYSGVVHDTAFFNLNINNHNTWATYYNNGKGMLIGQARCSTRAGASDTWAQNTYHSIADNFVSSLTDETGQDGAKYCYCNVTGYKNASGILQSLSSSWVFRNVYYGGSSSASNCAASCASDCAGIMRNTNSNSLAFRAALLGSVGASPALCEANTITINWDDVDPEYAGQNNEGTATYGEDVRTPVKANTYKGKTFKGWKFSKPTTTQLPN